MEDLLKQLVNLLQSKSRKVFSFFNQHSSPNAFEVFKQSRPTSKYTQFTVVKGPYDTYVVIRTRKSMWLPHSTYKELSKKDDFEPYYHAVFVIGIDDTMRLFCHRLEWHEAFENDFFLETLSYKDVLDQLGIDAHLYETEKIEGNKIYRVQGDIAIRVHYLDLKQLIYKVKELIDGDYQVKIFRKMLTFVQKQFNKNLKDFDFKGFVKKFFRTRKEENLKKLFYDNFKFLPEAFLDVIINNIKEFKTLLRDKYDIWTSKQEAVKRAIADMIQRYFRSDVSIDQAIKIIGELAEKEKIYNIRAGSHNIQLIGVCARGQGIISEAVISLLRKINPRIFTPLSNIFVLLRKQTIRFIHDEHRHVSVDIEFNENDQMAVIEILTLNAHIRQIRRQ